MLTYPEPKWFDDEFIVKHFRGRGYLSILDFGCGLAQQSRTLAEFLEAKGIEVHLTGDHHKDFMHVSPKLEALREAVRVGRYHDVLQSFIFCNPPSFSLPT